MSAIPMMAAPMEAPIADRTTHEKRSTDGCGDDVEELHTDTLTGLHSLQAEDEHHADERGGERRHHEQGDLGSVDGHTRVTRSILVTTGGKNPVSKLRPGEQPGRKDGGQYPPQNRDLEVGGSHRELGREDGVRGIEPEESSTFATRTVPVSSFVTARFARAERRT